MPIYKYYTAQGCLAQGFTVNKGSVFYLSFLFVMIISITKPESRNQGEEKNIHFLLEDFPLPIQLQKNLEK